jgi:tetratricopeptide (TPR) repeat protein
VRVLWTCCVLAVFVAPAGFVASAQQTEAERLFAEKDWEGAARAYKEVTAEDPENGRGWLRLGIALTSLGRYPEAVSAIEEAEKLSWLPPLTRFYLARASAFAGNKDDALHWLEKAVEAGYSSPDQIEGDDAFQDLRSDARFEKVVEDARIAAEPCAHIAEFRQFDFWVGEWSVTSGGQLAGENRVERLENGCLVMENWTSASGGSGKSMNFYDPAKKTWNQIWVDASGSNIFAAGSFHDGAMHFEGEHHYVGAPTQPFRMSFTPNPDGSVRQFIEQSQDGGKTWYVWFDGLYEKKK